MKVFHISDVLTITTGRLLSNRHMEGAYDIWNFMTGDSLYTHQLPRAARECEPWLQKQFPQLFPSNPLMEGLLSGLDKGLAGIKNNEYPESTPHDRFYREADGDRIEACVARWVETVRTTIGLPEHLPVYELGADMHTTIDPIEELEAMVGKDKVIKVVL